MLSLILWTRWPLRLLVLVLSFLSTSLGLLSLLFQKEFIDFLTHSEGLHFFSSWVQDPLLFVWFSFLCFLLAQALTQLCNYIGFYESLHMQKILAQRLYDKMLALKVDTLGQRSVGEIVSLYTTDVPGATVFLDQTLPAGASTLFPLILAPVVLVQIFNTSLWPTLSLMVLITVINTALAFRQSHFFFKFKQLAAERTGLVNEWIQNIRTLRVLGWTKEFEKKIFAKRELETENRVRMVTNGQVMNSISSSFTFIINVCTLGYLVFVTKKTLTPGEVLSLLWLLGVFLTRPFRQMPWFFTFAFDSWTSLKRLESFFQVENSSQRILPQNSTVSASKETSLEIKNLRLQINKHELLKGIDLRLHPGEVVAIVGEVGSGKSLLVLSLLGETNATWDSYFLNGEPILASQIDWKNKISYVPQESFMMSASITENILFDYDPNPKDFQVSQVKTALRLAEFDLLNERIPEGLKTEIGERGVNLSGGQKQRLSLARACFHNKDFIFLDDALSALDVETEKKIMSNLMLTHWKNKTRLIITHRLTILEKVDRVLFMKNGKIDAFDTYANLLKKNSDFREFTLSVQKEKPLEISQ